MYDGLDEIQELSPYEQVEALKLVLTTHATGGAADDLLFKELRRRLRANPDIKRRLPSFMRTCRSLSDFWSFIKAEESTYEGRRVFIRAAFEDLAAYLEDGADAPISSLLEEAVATLHVPATEELWRKMIARLRTDPEGAITAARTLVETVCKTICEDLGVPLSDDPELPELYKETAKALSLAPEQHQEKVFKQILGGCSGIVGGLAGVRNKLGDAHGRSAKAARPAPRHAALAVNLAGAMSVFLIDTWQAKRE